MGYNLIEISHEKVEDLSENLEKALRYAGKAMQCIDEMKQQPGMMGERRWANQYGSGRMYHRNYPVAPQGDYGMRDDMAYRMGRRQPEYEDPMMY